jgi:membrane protein YdbS with pleckstrin-like domain
MICSFVLFYLRKDGVNIVSVVVQLVVLVVVVVVVVVVPVVVKARLLSGQPGPDSRQGLGFFS